MLKSKRKKQKNKQKQIICSFLHYYTKICCGFSEEILHTFSTSVGFAKEEDKTPDTTPQNTFITIVSSEKQTRASIRFRMFLSMFHYSFRGEKKKEKEKKLQTV